MKAQTLDFKQVVAMELSLMPQELCFQLTQNQRSLLNDHKLQQDQRQGMEMVGKEVKVDKDTIMVL